MMELPTPAAPADVRPMALMSRRSKADPWLVVLVAAIGFFIGVRYFETFRATGQPYDFAQLHFGAAVAMACGHGFVDPGDAPSAPFGDFLREKRDAITCADLPPIPPSARPTFAQGLYRYFMESAGLVWRIRGISWSGLWPLFGLAYGLTLIAAYGLFRLGMGPLIATTATLLFAVSASHMAHVVYLRDYAKAPFILLLMLIAAAFARAGITVRQRLWLSAAFGVVLGIGFGFRNDLLIMLPAFVAVIVLRGGSLSRRDLVMRVAYLMTAGVTFVVTAWPLITAYSNGSNNGHVIMLGFMTNFDRPMGVQESLYDWGDQYNDALVATLASSYAVRTTGASLAFVSRDYDVTLMKYIGQIVRDFPADIVTRTYASSLRIFELPFAPGAYTNPTPYGMQSDRLLDLYRRERIGLRAMSGSGVFVVAASLVLIGSSDVAGALLLTVMVVYFAGYPAIQFHVRHFFHLEFITWWACGFLLQALLTGPRLWRSLLRRDSLRRAAAFALMAGVMLFVPFATLRAYQDGHVRELLGEYQRRPKAAVEVTRQAAPGGRVLFAAPGLWGGGDLKGPPDRLKLSVETEFLTATFTPDRCDSMTLPVTLRYEARNESTDYSRVITIPADRAAGPTSIMFPAFWHKEWARFAGIEVAATDAGCFAGLARTVNLDGLALALNVLFLPDWQARPLHQTIAGWERPAIDRTSRIIAVPDTLSLKRSYLAGPLTPPGSSINYQSAIVTGTAPGPFTFRGVPDTAYGYILTYVPRAVPSGAVLVVEGQLMRGGLTIGVLRDGQWSTARNITERGPFAIVMQPGGAATYQVVVASNLNETLIESRRTVAAALRRAGLLGPPTQAVITKIGWFDGAAPGEPVH